MQLFRAFHQTEALAELVVQRLDVISHNIETTAPCRALRSKCAYDHMTTGFHGLCNLVNIEKAVLGAVRK